jgi:hypothetical protein
MWQWYLAARLPVESPSDRAFAMTSHSMRAIFEGLDVSTFLVPGGDDGSWSHVCKCLGSVAILPTSALLGALGGAGGGDHFSAAEKNERRIIDIIGLEEREHCALVGVIGSA